MDVSHTQLRGFSAAEISLICAPPLVLVLVCVICSLKPRHYPQQRRVRLERGMENTANDEDYVPGEDWCVVAVTPPCRYTASSAN